MFDEGYLLHSPAEKVGFPSKGKSASNRPPFSPDQLNILFSSSQYDGHKSDQQRYAPGSLLIRDGKYWIPLIGLYTGMRLGEIVQLLVSDIKREVGVAYIDVTKDEKGKTLKTFQVDGRCRSILP